MNPVHIYIVVYIGIHIYIDKNGTSLFNLLIIYRLNVNDYGTFFMIFLTMLLI